MEIINLSFNSVPLSTSYIGDVDLQFIKKTEILDQGYEFIKEKYLDYVMDNKINNYSSIYLTSKQKLDKICNLKALERDEDIRTFSTTIQYNKLNMLLTVSNEDIAELPYYFAEINRKYVDFVDTMFEIVILDTITTKIVHKNANNGKTYYLHFNNTNFSFLSTDNNSDTTFNYILDKFSNKLILFKNNKIISTYNNLLTALDYTNNYKYNYFTVNYYIQDINNKPNTSWVSYNSKHVNVYDIDPFKSRKDLENNYLISTQYSYITGNSIEANLLVLKNQKTNKNYNYRSDYTELANDNVPVVDSRNYIGLFTGNDQEGGDHSITLSYEFYNADYKFKTDEYTSFTSPESLHPYKQININDLQWNYRGAMAGETPYLSDKIFQKRLSENSTEYLCSWLYKNRNGESIWLDRYYYPEKVSYVKALQTKYNYVYIDPLTDLLDNKLSASEYYDVPDLYNSIPEEYLHTPQTGEDALYGITFFDKRSDLVITPNSEYLYHRIGNKYVQDILSELKKYIITDGLNLKTENNGDIYHAEVVTDKIKYNLNGNAYASIEAYEDINKEHQYTISFWFKSDDWTSKFGHQLIGNLNNKGFALLNDRKITPFITIQNKSKIYTYNTNFESIDIASLENENLEEYIIKDIYRTDHLDSFHAISTTTIIPEQSPYNIK